MKTPPSPELILQWAARHPDGIEGLLSRRSTKWKEAGLDQGLPEPATLAALMASEPRLMRRPIIYDDARLVVGYDEAALERLLR